MSPFEGLPSAPRTFVPRAGPPRRLRALWAVLDFDDPRELEAGLEALSAHLPGGLTRLLLRYRAETLSRRAVAAHRGFLEAHPQISSLVPLCAPDRPADLRAAATPEDCRGCLYFEGGACQGMGWHLSARRGGTLRPFEGDLPALAALDFAADEPPAYWRPTRADVAAIGAAVRAVGARLWDVGGANGFLAGLLARDEGLAVSVLDPVPFPSPTGVERVQAGAEALPAAARAVLVSWPPVGEGFREALARVQPELIIYALDGAGFCGRRPGFAGVHARGPMLQWYGYAHSDFAAWPGRPVQLRRKVLAYADLRANRGATGVLQIRAARATPSGAPAKPYPWE